MKSGNNRKRGRKINVKRHHGESVIRSNLSKANEQRGPRNVEYFAYILIEEARRLREGDVDETFFYRGDIYAFKLFGGAGSIMTKAV